MDEEREDGGPTSKTTLSGEHGRQSKATRRRQERADPPGPSCVSMKSDRYMGELQRIRSEFVKGVSEPVIKGLLDDLWQQKVFSSEEKDYVMAERTKADQARCLIDMVIGKGERASQAMIDSMKKRDEHLCSTLGLISSPPGVGSAAVQCQHKIKSNLQKKFRCVFEGIAKAGHSTPLNEFYTEIFIHEERQVERSTRSMRNKGNVKLYQSAVDKALQREDGRLDLFLRFLLGLSLETNQIVLKVLLGKEHGQLWSSSYCRQKEELDVFDLKKYSASEEGLLRLLPVVKASKTSMLNGCGLSEDAVKLWPQFSAPSL
ncbi:unnamed protein product [Gadus morhua 'NCC']